LKDRLARGCLGTTSCCCCYCCFGTFIRSCDDFAFSRKKILKRVCVNFDIGASPSSQFSLFFCAFNRSLPPSLSLSLLITPQIQPSPRHPSGALPALKNPVVPETACTPSADVEKVLQASYHISSHFPHMPRESSSANPTPPPSIRRAMHALPL
jgi:hypothetical protein